MTHPKCPLCDSKSGVKWKCEVCEKQFCRSCCYHYLALEKDPTTQVRTCNECFLKNVAWDPTRTYDVFGPEEGKPVVLVHGALIGRHCMVQEAKALAEAGYRVVVPDLPAHGARFKEQPLTLGNAVSTLYEVIQQEAPDKRVVMMGFSMGGYVAAAFAAAHPEMCAGVVMGACAHDCHNFKWKMVGHMAEAVYNVCSDKTKSEFIYKSTAGGHQHVHVMDPARPEIQEGFMRAGAEMDGWKYVWRVMHDANMRKLLPKITCPALLAVGETDYRSHEKEWLSLLPHGRLLVLKGGVHAFIYQPKVSDDFRREAIKFLATAAWDGTLPPAPPAPPAATAAAGADAKGESQAAAGGDVNTGGSAAAAVVEPQQELAPPPAVGLGVVFANVLAQFRGPHKEQPQPAAGVGSDKGAGAAPSRGPVAI